ncbi:MAG TPA: amylo-alpha-1,6-glucosidase [Syntrophorhabdaceae bacterium]|nr:amylo-alpha-1,6-glucosidase [Syntrophorhabdaceae bacterium]
MAEEIIPVREHFYILSTSSRIDDRTRVLKQGDTFAVFDRHGDIETFGTGELGIYHHDTRFLSRLTLTLANERPLLLSSSVKDDNAALAIDSMNPDISRDNEITVPRGTVHIFRSKFLWNGTCHERIRIHNHGRSPVSLGLIMKFGADFSDIFEVRGTRREQRGRQLPRENSDGNIMYSYAGVDGRLRRTTISFDPHPTICVEDEVIFDVHLQPGKEEEYRYAVTCEIREEPDMKTAPVITVLRYDRAHDEAAQDLQKRKSATAIVTTSNEKFNDWLNRSTDDLDMMWTDTSYGPYPYAGVPWFCTAFGRDGIIAALEYLNLNPELARGVLGFLAANQAQTISPEQDAEPGKVLHETRDGEMAVSGEVPFYRYYGSIDATPLFIILAGAYYDRTGDLQFIESIWSSIEKALTWITEYGDRDRDGFVEYARRSHHGLIQQGWKDSQDSVFHADGIAAQGPIALCEVQGYVYSAQLAGSRLAVALGDKRMADELFQKAIDLQNRFETAFWCEAISTYVLALDGYKQQTKVRTSNAGHCLFSGIATKEHARRVAMTLMSDTSFSGWGIRTVAISEALYNPMSYHNGSVWPHDNAMIAAGFAKYGFKDQVIRILSGMLDASLFFDLHRLPELFCGFRRRSGEAPTLYPVACAPQAWSSGAVFLLLESCLGLSVQGSQREVVFTNPVLPEVLKQVSIRNLRVGEAVVDILATRHQGDVSINVTRREGPLDVIIVK